MWLLSAAAFKASLAFVFAHENVGQIELKYLATHSNGLIRLAMNLKIFQLRPLAALLARLSAFTRLSSRSPRQRPCIIQSPVSQVRQYRALALHLGIGYAWQMIAFESIPNLFYSTLFFR